MLAIFIITYIACLCSMTAGFILARRVKRVDVIDVYWGITIVVASVTALVLSPQATVAGYVTAALVMVWGYRLSSHITRRITRTKVQDERYTAIMSRWPKRHMQRQIYVKLFVTQSVLAFIVALPAVLVAQSSTYTTGWLAVGVLVWLIGFGFEAVGDKQLAAFLARPANRGKLMTGGLWRYTRHPNYFGEVTMWWGIWFVSLGTPYWWIGAIGPVAITYLIRFVSGVPLAEKRSATKPGWADYAKRTPVLFPSLAAQRKEADGHKNS